MFTNSKIKLPLSTNSCDDSRKSKNSNNLPFICNPGTYWVPEVIDQGLFQGEYFNEWKDYLLNKNLAAIKMAAVNKYRFTFFTPKLVRAIFNICQLLKQPPDVRYLAVDILDRFLTCHFLQVAERYETMENADVSDWLTLMERMLKQTLLRILTCIQIAIKYCSNCNTITVQTVQGIMTYLKHPYKYSKRNIIKSEARIYKTLNYNISNATPLIYVEMLVEDFQRQIFFQCQRPSLYDFFTSCIDVLDVALIHHKLIYENLLLHGKKMNAQLLESATFKANDSTNNEENESYEKILRTSKADFVSFAASIVFAASVLHDLSTEFTQYLIENSQLNFTQDPKRHNIVTLGREVLKLIGSD